MVRLWRIPWPLYKLIRIQADEIKTLEKLRLLATSSKTSQLFLNEMLQLLEKESRELKILGLFLSLFLAAVEIGVD